MPATLQNWLITARAARRLSQQELANMADVSLFSIGRAERGEIGTWSTRVAAKVGQALFEIREFTPDEMSDFLRLTGVPAAIFAGLQRQQPQHQPIDILIPLLQKLLDSFGMHRTMVLLQACSALASPTVTRQPAEEPQTLRHVGAPKYRPELGGTEVTITEYEKPAKPKATPITGATDAAKQPATPPPRRRNSPQG